MSGHGKGSDFERTICKELGLWWTDGARDDIFWRTSNSGGRATVRKGRSTFGGYGDVQAVDPIGQPLLNITSIELKRGYGQASVGDLLDVGKAPPQWARWVEQAEMERGQGGQPYWMLITRRDRRSAVVHIPAPFASALRDAGGDVYRAPTLFRIRYNGIAVISLPLFYWKELVSHDNILTLEQTRGGKDGADKDV